MKKLINMTKNKYIFVLHFIQRKFGTKKIRNEIVLTLVILDLTYKLQGHNWTDPWTPPGVVM